jgi:ribosomal protein S18 acetylase RimI-like enzyme
LTDMNDVTQPPEAEAQHIGTFWVTNFDTQVNIVPRLPATFMRVGPEAAQELAQAIEVEDTALVLQRFARGCRCYAGRIEGKIVTYGWVTFDEEGIGELGLSFRLQPGKAYIWDCATLPAFRGQRLYPALLTFMLGELYNAGIQRVWIGADADNLPSQKGFILAGFLPVADMLLKGDPASHKLWLRGRAGVPDELVAEVRQALFGEQDEAG